MGERPGERGLREVGEQKHSGSGRGGGVVVGYMEEDGR